jgi:hypothetical protein
VRADKKLKELKKPDFSSDLHLIQPLRNQHPRKQTKETAARSLRPVTSVAIRDTGHETVTSKRSEICCNSNSVEAYIRVENNQFDFFETVHDTENVSPSLRLKTNLSKWKDIYTVHVQIIMF